MRERNSRRAIVALVGVGASVASVAVAPVAAHAAPDLVPTDAVRAGLDPTPAMHLGGPCTTFRTFAVFDGLQAYAPSNNDFEVNCTLHQGMYNSPAVTKLQHNLNLCYGQGLTVDGDFGPATTTAVQNVQRFKGMATTGVYDYALYSEMSIGVWNVTGPNPVPAKDGNNKPICIGPRFY